MSFNKFYIDTQETKLKNTLAHLRLELRTLILIGANNEQVFRSELKCVKLDSFGDF